MGTGTFPLLHYLRSLQIGLVVSATNSCKWQELAVSSFFIVFADHDSQIQCVDLGYEHDPGRSRYAKVNSSIMQIPNELCNNDFYVQQPCCFEMTIFRLADWCPFAIGILGPLGSTR